MIYIAKPTVVRQAKKPDYSLSEGEAPLSPGDARWNALHASKLKRNVKEKKKKGKLTSQIVILHILKDLKLYY